MDRISRIIGLGLLLSSAAMIASPSVAAAKTVKIFNTTHYAIVALQSKKSADKDWHPDLLGKIALGVGKFADVDVDCASDLRATFDDSHKVEKHGADVCKAEIYSFTDE